MPRHDAPAIPAGWARRERSAAPAAPCPAAYASRFGAEVVNRLRHRTGAHDALPSPAPECRPAVRVARPGTPHAPAPRPSPSARPCRFAAESTRPPASRAIARDARPSSAGEWHFSGEAACPPLLRTGTDSVSSRSAFGCRFGAEEPGTPSRTAANDTSSGPISPRRSTAPPLARATFLSTASVSRRAGVLAVRSPLTELRPDSTSAIARLYGRFSGIRMPVSRYARYVDPCTASSTEYMLMSSSDVPVSGSTSLMVKRRSYGTLAPSR